MITEKQKELLSTMKDLRCGAHWILVTLSPIDEPFNSLGNLENLDVLEPKRLHPDLIQFEDGKDYENLGEMCRNKSYFIHGIAQSINIAIAICFVACELNKRMIAIEAKQHIRKWSKEDLPLLTSYAENLALFCKTFDKEVIKTSSSKAIRKAYREEIRTQIQEIKNDVMKSLAVLEVETLLNN